MRKLAQISSQLPICQQTVNNDRARSLERFLQQPQTKGAEDRPGALLVSQARNIPSISAHLRRTSQRGFENSHTHRIFDRN
jgi:hypothetical protein